MIGGHVIEIKPQRLVLDGLLTDVLRIWVMDSHGDELCVYGLVCGNEGPSLREAVWWSSGFIFYDCDRKKLHKVGYSFRPSEHELGPSRS